MSGKAKDSRLWRAIYICHLTEGKSLGTWARGIGYQLNPLIAPHWRAPGGFEPGVLASHGVVLGRLFSGTRTGGPGLRKPELDTSKLQFSTGNGKRVTGDSKSEIKLCYVFQAVWPEVAW